MNRELLHHDNVLLSLFLFLCIAAASLGACMGYVGGLNVDWLASAATTTAMLGAIAGLCFGISFSSGLER